MTDDENGFAMNERERTVMGLACRYPAPLSDLPKDRFERSAHFARHAKDAVAWSNELLRAISADNTNREEAQNPHTMYSPEKAETPKLDPYFEPEAGSKRPRWEGHDLAKGAGLNATAGVEFVNEKIEPVRDRQALRLAVNAWLDYGEPDFDSSRYADWAKGYARRSGKLRATLAALGLSSAADCKTRQQELTLLALIARAPAEPSATEAEIEKLASDVEAWLLADKPRHAVGSAYDFWRERRTFRANALQRLLRDMGVRSVRDARRPTHVRAIRWLLATNGRPDRAPFDPLTNSERNALTMRAGEWIRSEPGQTKLRASRLRECLDDLKLGRVRDAKTHLDAVSIRETMANWVSVDEAPFSGGGVVGQADDARLAAEKRAEARRSDPNWREIVFQIGVGADGKFTAWPVSDPGPTPARSFEYNTGGPKKAPCEPGDPCFETPELRDAGAVEVRVGDLTVLHWPERRGKSIAEARAALRADPKNAPDSVKTGKGGFRNWLRTKLYGPDREDALATERLIEVKPRRHWVG